MYKRQPSKLRDIDLIIGCGDLSLHYMNFLSDAAPVPVLYVHGNHDASYDKEPPRGAICIDDDLYWYKGYRIVGLGGSCRYRAGADVYKRQLLNGEDSPVQGKVCSMLTIYTQRGSSGLLGDDARCV